MTQRISHIFTWKMASEGATELATEMGLKKIRHENSRFKGSTQKTVINWGSSELPPEVRKCQVLNKPEAISLCSNKLSFFNHVSKSKLSIPDVTTDMNTAIRWTTEGFIVCARTVLQGHSAQGLILMDKDHPEAFVKAPLYTKYVPKMDEYRIHVFRKEVVDSQRKALRPDFEGEVNHKVRNLDNGYIYVRRNVNPPPSVLEQALMAIEVTGLDFGAVDVIYQEKKQRAFVLEINTAPGLQGTTVQNYAAAFRRM